MNKIKLLPVFILFLFSSFLTGQTEPDLVIKNVTVIDVNTGKALAGKDVVVKGNKIIHIADSAPALTGKYAVDGKGKFLIPGLWDMHTHNWWQIHFSKEYVKNGVLGVRNMYTPMQFIKPLKDSINSGLLTGPNYYAAGRVIEGVNPSFPDWIVVDAKEKISKALDSLQMEGSDFVKVYNKIPRDVYFELVKQAKARGLSVEGHLPMEVTAIEASNAGQRSFEHMLGIPDLTTDKRLFNNRHNNDWFVTMIQEDDYGTLQIDEKIAAENFALLKKNNTYVCPTLVVLYSYLHPDTEFEKEKVFGDMPKEIAGYWIADITNHRKKSAEYKQMAAKKYENIEKTAYLLYKNNVPLLAGTDAMNPFCYPGYSLHTELELLKEAGIPDAEVLKTATINPAKFMNLKDQGEIKEGYTASMLLLDGNPLEDIKNTRKIKSVILNGKVIDPEKF